ncbi:MAG: phenylalanine--tRNA ligase subunit beta [Candidatus Actinomarina sp.]
MKILKSWLNDWIELGEISNQDISEAFESLGFEIEEHYDLKPNYSNIVVGKVEDIYTHPNADKVRVTKTNVGSKTYEIVCGAWNFEIGAVVPVALPKSVIKDGFEIDKRDIRGVESNGMICSASELDLWDDHEGILLLDDKILPGTDFSSIYPSTDYLWDIGITPNRGDCMSYMGIARELSNYFDSKIKLKKTNIKPSITNIITTNSGEIMECDTYGSVEIENFKVTDSSFLIRYRLSNVGTRIINNVVDITNYILYDIGQPLHAFDRDKLFGTVSVRKANNNEKVMTLDSQERKLTNEDLIITDDDKPIALAGVMGGLETEVTESTVNLLIESAYFDKVSIMKTSRKLSLISDASIRFERGIDFNIQEYGLEQFLMLLKDNQDIKYSELSVDKKNNIKNKKVILKKDEIKNLLGINLKDSFVKKTLKYLMIDSEIKDKTIEFTAPSWRYDLDRSVDLIEEFAKHYGFNNFESNLPQGLYKNEKGNYWNVKEYLSNILTSNNFQEIQTLSFVSKEKNKVFNPEKKYVTVFNAIDKTNNYLRSNLLSSLLDTYTFNLQQNNILNSYFEINTIFDSSVNTTFKDVPNQNVVLGFLTSAKLTNSDIRKNDDNIDIYFVKNLINQLVKDNQLENIPKPGFHQNYSFSIFKNNAIVGHFGQLSTELQMKHEIDSDIYLGEIYINKLDLSELKVIDYKPLSQYPYIKFDLSFSVPVNFSAQLIINEINNLLNENENNIEIFDDFQHENSRNLGIRIVTRNYEQTYNDNETREILINISNTLETKFDIKLNSGNND